MTEEEIKAMQEENTRLKAENANKDERITSLEEITRTQSTNFKKLKDMSAKEKEALSEQEMATRMALEETMEKLSKFETSAIETQKKDIETKRDKFISMYAGSDPVKKEKILAEYNRLSDPEDSEDNIAKRTVDAVKLAGFQVPDGSAIFNANNHSGNVDTPKGGGFADTDEGKSLSSKLGFSEPTKD